MLVEQLTVLSSIQLVIGDRKNANPDSFGSGCLVNYQKRNFIISVSHVTDINNDLIVYMETNIPNDRNGVILKPIGGFCHFDLLQISEDINPKEFENLLNNGKRLDISFAELKNDIHAFQREIDFGPFKVEKGGKAILDLEDATSPSKEYVYSFFGNVGQKLEGKLLHFRPTLKNNLKFHRTNNKSFHMFLAPEIILDSEDYEGCSGAPILANDGRIVALACKVVTNSKVIYGFSIQECIKLLDLAIKTNLV